MLRTQTEDVMITLASPYPEGKMSVVLSQTSQLVDEDLKPVPLSDVYVRIPKPLFASICLTSTSHPLTATNEAHHGDSRSVS